MKTRRDPDRTYYQVQVKNRNGDWAPVCTLTRRAGAERKAARLRVGTLCGIRVERVRGVLEASR